MRHGKEPDRREVLAVVAAGNLVAAVASPDLGVGAEEPSVNSRLAVRFRRLEQENRRFKKLAIVGLAVGAVVIAAAAMASKRRPESITVTKLILVDEENQARAVLETDKNNNPRLLFKDKNGKSQAALGFDRHGNPQLVYDQPDGRQILELYGAPLDGTPYLRFYRAAGSGHEASLQLSKRALEIIGVGDRTGIELSVDAQGKPKVIVNEPCADERK